MDKRKSVPGNTAFVLNSQTGMIGRPEQTEDRVIVRSMINPALTVHSKVHINQSSIQQADPDYQTITSDVSQRNMNLANTGKIAADGTYLIYFMERIGDTRGTEWDDISTVIAIGSTPNAAQTPTIPSQPPAWTQGTG